MEKARRTHAQTQFPNNRTFDFRAVAEVSSIVEPHRKAKDTGALACYFNNWLSFGIQFCNGQYTDRKDVLQGCIAYWTFGIGVAPKHIDLVAPTKNSLGAPEHAGTRAVVTQRKADEQPLTGVNE